jgi:hypothetical protein
VRTDASAQLEIGLAGLSKLNSVSEPEVDVVLGDPNDPDERPAEAGRHRRVREPPE